MTYTAVAVAAYLLGSIPTGYLVAKARGIDIRSVGSGNIGATNAFRVLGKPAGTFVLLIDALKGYAAASWLVALLAPLLDVATVDLNWLRITAGICAVLGHNYTCWLKFKGGKGIATTAGVYLALAPIAVSVALMAWLIVALITRYVSAASIAAAIALPTAVWLTQDSMLLGVVTTALGALAIFKHRNNIQRLMNGTENKIGRKVTATGGAR
ncbi:MAG TPA: glycerol-3-phosphate 1-O-acyltransferase PlsY [Verrucomicrobiae bacterium]|nr:glycerol-3-phosphate 1-O-acyltransferase PlsY [Verrucomicrobiae bacterium]